MAGKARQGKAILTREFKCDMNLNLEKMLLVRSEVFVNYMYMLLDLHVVDVIERHILFITSHQYSSEHATKEHQSSASPALGSYMYYQSLSFLSFIHRVILKPSSTLR